MKPHPGSDQPFIAPGAAFFGDYAMNPTLLQRKHIPGSTLQKNRCLVEFAKALAPASLWPSRTVVTWMITRCLEILFQASCIPSSQEKSQKSFDQKSGSRLGPKLWAPEVRCNLLLPKRSRNPHLFAGTIFHKKKKFQTPKNRQHLWTLVEGSRVNFGLPSIVKSRFAHDILQASSFSELRYHAGSAGQFSKIFCIIEKNSHSMGSKKNDVIIPKT